MYYVLHRIYKNDSKLQEIEGGIICGDIDPSFDNWIKVSFFPSEEEAYKFLAAQLNVLEFDFYHYSNDEYQEVKQKFSPFYTFDAKDTWYERDINSFSLHELKEYERVCREYWSEEYIGLAIGEVK